MRGGFKLGFAVVFFGLSITCLVMAWGRFGENGQIDKLVHGWLNFGSLTVYTDKKSYGVESADRVEIWVKNGSRDVARIWYASPEIQQLNEDQKKWIKVEKAIQDCPCGAFCNVPPFWSEVEAGENKKLLEWDKRQHYCSNNQEVFSGRLDLTKKSKYRVKMKVSYGKFAFNAGVVDGDMNGGIKVYEVYSPEFWIE
jgi:hypothetical protein